jgi:death on curing protein
VTEPKWLDVNLVLAIHHRQIERYGGDLGIRDLGLLESALARPQQHWHYTNPTVFQLAGVYADGIAKNHAFVDGNKRTAFVASVLFLEENGFHFRADPADAEYMFLRVAEGAVDETQLAQWFEVACRDHADYRPGGIPLVDRE